MPEHDTPQVSVLIVAYQAKRMTLDCLESVFEHTRGVSFEVLLIDNGTDGTQQAVADAFPEVRLVPSPGNVGFGGGNNVAARHARGRYLLLLNPDTLLHDDAISALARCAQAHPEAGAWGGLTILPDGRRDPSCMQIGPSLWTSVVNAIGFGRWRRGGLPEGATEPAPVKVLSGAFMMVEAEAWRALGGFDESFFMYNEEVDLCYRIRQRLGRPVVMTPEARVTHLVGSGQAANPRRIVAMMQSRMHFDRKHHGRLHNAIKGALTYLHAATRYHGATLARPIIGAERARTLREAFRPMLKQPGRWFYGYPESPASATEHAPTPPKAAVTELPDGVNV